MIIRTNYSGDAALHRKIDQAYEMAGLARADRDYKDEQHWLNEVKPP